MNSQEENVKSISDWLVNAAITEQSIREVLAGFAEKLQSAGVPVHRINCSTFQRHQIMGAVDTTWDEDAGSQETEFVPKFVITDQNILKTPAGGLARSDANFDRYDLTNPERRSTFQALESLYDRGFVDYIILKKPYGKMWHIHDKIRESEGVYGSFSTKYGNGFSDEQVEIIKSVWAHFSLFLKSATERLLSEKLLAVYVGDLPASNILDGMIERGDGRSISCVLWYSDLRSSTQLSTSLPSEEYLKLVNNYFDCTAASVVEHGGEVLKFIGDGVMAIFPFERGGEQKACGSALAAARQSLEKAEQLKDSATESSIANFQFGIGLHVGEVILGNVGTAQRLDMTVTGLSANQVTRVEALTKVLSLSVLASPQFHALHPEMLHSVGKYPVPDLGGMTEIFCLVS
ncbi:MAG: adenylate/guanylate cyclase domain-containing protein [Pseudomonadota bacterium]